MNTVEVSTPARARIEWVDAAKGVGIILVVIGHAIVGLRDGSLIPKDGTLAYILNLIYSFHMPLFFFLSGIFIARRVASGAFEFSKSSTTKLGKAYLIWLPVQMLMLGLAGSLANKPMDSSLFDFISILWEPRYNFWFIYALILMNILSALVMPNFGVTALIVASLLLYSLAHWIKFPPFLWGLCWFAPHYAVGVIYGLHPVQAKLGRPALLVAAAIVTAIWFYIASELQTRGVSLWQISTVATAITGTAATLLWVGASNRNISSALAYLGREALPIYLIHVMFTAGTRIVINKILHIDNEYVILVLSSIAGIAGPLLIKKTADRMKISSQIGLA